MSFAISIIEGRLTRDVELKTIEKDGKSTPYCNFTVAVDRSYKKGDEKVTDFFNCVAFGHHAEFVAKYGKKGTAFVVSGTPEIDTYKKNDVQMYSYKIRVAEVRFSSGGSSKGEGGAPVPVQPTEPASDPAPSESAPVSEPVQSQPAPQPSPVKAEEFVGGGGIFI